MMTSMKPKTKLTKTVHVVKDADRAAGILATLLASITPASSPISSISHIYVR